MWHWDQGHLAFFQFDALRQIAAFVNNNDFRNSDRATVETGVGMLFPAPKTHSPWRQYSRVLKLCLLVSEVGDRAEATPVSVILAKPGSVTCDEYFHFLVRAFTEPSPALEDWRPDANFRYPLLFALKYLLTKSAIGAGLGASIDEIIGAYRTTGFVGDEDDTRFIAAVGNVGTYEAAARDIGERRQARESLQVMAQISYLHMKGPQILVSLDPADAQAIFADLTPIIGPRAADRNAEIRRLAALFEGGTTNDFFDYPNTIVNEIVESGFSEGSKVKKTHITIERNRTLRREFFLARPTAVCDVCITHTEKTYPWTDGVLDIHHLLPLSSGTRVEADGTTFDDLVPVCPTCHRAVHRYYDRWLSAGAREDFENKKEAVEVYQRAKKDFPGVIHA